VNNETTGYAYSNDIGSEAIKQAAETAKLASQGNVSQELDVSPAVANQKFYKNIDTVQEQSFRDKASLLQEIDRYARAQDNRVKQVSIQLLSRVSEIEILRPDGQHLKDYRPSVRLYISVIMQSNRSRESGGAGKGGRYSIANVTQPDVWQDLVAKAIHKAKVNLEAEDAPAGTMEVALGSGWPGILLHEAIGHGLEGDSNRKKTSVFSSLLGEQIASEAVTVYDDGTVNEARGSLNFDDEGQPTQATPLIEKGRLVGYMQDRLNARLMKVSSTGNGRRESFEHAPMPRMTNTYMINGTHTPEDIIASVKDGIYAADFGGGQVDTTSGKFVFTCTEAYRVKNGKILHPIKGATLIGDGATALKHIKMVGNDMALDPGIGTCGKSGQWVPVTVGQPTLLIDNITVGGSSVEI
jgi:TldD protein